MRRQRKKYETPLKPWDKKRIEEEKKLLKEYGLRRKSEIWRAESMLRNFRRIARSLEAKRDEKREKELLSKVARLGLLPENSTIEDVLGLEVRNILDRRLQTIVYKKGMSNTIKQARQFIVHGHIAVNNRRVVWPSMIVPSEHESSVSFYEKSRVKDQFLKKTRTDVGTESDKV